MVHQGAPPSAESPDMIETRRVTFSAGSGCLDRAAHLRDERARLLAGDRARLLPMHEGRVLVDLGGEGPGLGWVEPDQAALDDAVEVPVFLGMDGDAPLFTAEFAGLDDDAARTRFREGTKFIDLRSICGELSAADASIAATAKGVLGWHMTHRFCARCGAPTVPENGGWRRACETCRGQHFPRTDPVVIMLILHGDEVLLGRQRIWPPGLHSLLAGFMEPGETIEDAVRRETFEEAAIRVGPVGYVGCQPWPFPASLMLGCVGIAETRQIRIDPNELEAAMWIRQDEMRVILAGEHPVIASPRRDAIARALLTDWVNGDITLPE